MERHLRLAMGAGLCRCGRLGDGETLCSKVRSRRSPGRTKLAEPSSDRAVRFYPSRSSGFTSTTVLPILVCAFGEQERSTALTPLVSLLPYAYQDSGC